MTKHNCQDLILLFNDLFAASEKTILIGNAEEPIYLPADDTNKFHRVIFTRDYFASALHEIAHWCLAGDARRQQIDYGYWYFPEGRSAEQQKLFEDAEIKPQAIEYLFAMAAGSRFLVSQDNFTPGHGSSPEEFTRRVTEQAQIFLAHGLPERARLFRECLARFYQTS
jgi:elongation factor P hydroxylase